MERVMYNTVHGAKALQADGRAFYYSDYNPDGRKAYFSAWGGLVSTSEWPFCSGTLPQLAADYRISTYFHDSGGIYANLYLPSTLRWQHGNERVIVSQTGDHPLGDSVSLDFSLTRPSVFELRLRIPSWTRTPSAYLNGRRPSESVKPGSLFTLRRSWKSGDRIELNLPKRLELHPLDRESPNLVALTYGPLVLFGITDETRSLPRAQLLSAARGGSSSAEWSAKLDNGSLTLKPFWEIKNERYTTYFEVA